jgi:predicted PurR-regulated permease PerM
VTLGKWIGLAVLCISLFILWQIRQVILLVFAAVVLASGMNALARLLIGRFKLKRGVAIPLVIGFLLSISIVFGLLVIPPFVAQSKELAALVPQSLDRLESLFHWLEQKLPGQSLINDNFLQDLQKQFTPLVGPLVGNFFAIFSNSLAVVLNILLVVILSIMFLLEPEKHKGLFVRLFPAFYRCRIDEVLKLCETALENWMAGTLFNMFVIGLSSFIALLILQVRLPLANALIAGVFEAIPTIGPALSVFPPMAIALLDSPWKAGLVLALYFLIQQLEQYLLVPTVMAKQVSLLPAVTLLSQIVFAIFFGFLGLLLALPLVIVGQIWIKEILVKDVLDHWQEPPHPLS